MNPLLFQYSGDFYQYHPHSESPGSIAAWHQANQIILLLSALPAIVRDLNPPSTILPHFLLAYLPAKLAALNPLLSVVLLFLPTDPGCRAEKSSLQEF